LTPNNTHPTPGTHQHRLEDGPGRYRLVAIVSHMGSSTACGHYVAHVFKGGRWVIFNDEKVGELEDGHGACEAAWCALCARG
jgi:ubiquitin carboxyl-terminal hydrolase 5/13